MQMAISIHCLCLFWTWNSLSLQVMSKTAIYPEPVYRTVEGGGYFSVNVLIFNGHWKLCPQGTGLRGKHTKKPFCYMGIGEGGSKIPTSHALKSTPFSVLAHASVAPFQLYYAPECGKRVSYFRFTNDWMSLPVFLRKPMPCTIFKENLTRFLMDKHF